jgi:hypothetical protein
MHEENTQRLSAKLAKLAELTAFARAINVELNDTQRFLAEVLTLAPSSTPPRPNSHE